METGVAAFFCPISCLSITSQQHSRNNSSVECILVFHFYDFFAEMQNRS